MKILFAASEVAPFIKTGGLADVAGSLPKALAKAGHEVKVILPLYEGIGPQWREQMTFCCYFNVTLAWRRSYCGIFSLERDGVTYWFVDNEYYFKRYDIYGHFDDAERFAFFSRAIIETSEHMGFAPDVLHCNDWQTALAPIYLLEERYRLSTLANTRSVFTIHNIEYQGRYGKDLIEDVFGLDRSYVHAKMLEYYDDINLMKGAIYASDYVTTVSPTYAEELRYPFYAHGLEGVISDCSSKIRGILNGLDIELYDPSTDTSLAAPFSSEDLSGKAACKTALQQALGLNPDPNVPIVACVSRLVPHKGFELVVSAIHQIMACNLQMVVLGTGNWNFEEAFRQAETQYPGRFAARIQYSAPLSSAIYGGADLFLMPSISEPCGLSQMIAMRYGTLPIVRETGGLKDTVPPYNPITGEGLGFTFSNTTKEDMLGAIYRSMEVYFDHPDAFAAMRKRAMEADFSWTRSALSYLDIYYTVTGLSRPMAHEPEPAAPAEGEEETGMAVKEPAGSPVVKEPAPSPAVKEPAASPAVKEPALHPVVQEPAPTKAPEETGSAQAEAEPPKAAAKPAPKAAAKKPAAAKKAPAKKAAPKKAAAKKPAKPKETDSDSGEKK